MSTIFDEHDSHYDASCSMVEPVKFELPPKGELGAIRRRLEKLLEKKRLRDELDDFIDYE